MASQGTPSSRVDDIRSLALALRNLRDCDPPAHGAVRTTVTLALLIIDASESVSIATDTCKNLAIRTAHLALGITTLSSLPEGTLNRRIIWLTGIFTGVLNVMQEAVNESNKRGFARITRILKHREVEDKINAQLQRINDAEEEFKTITLVDLRRTIARLLPAAPPDVLDIGGIHVDVFPRADIEYTEPFERLPYNVTIHRGSLKRREFSISVVVKQYDQDDKQRLREDLRHLIKLMHSNVPKVIGASPSEEPRPYLLMTHYDDYSAKSYLGEKIQGNAVDGFMSTLMMMRDVISALHFLNSTAGVSKADLEACGDVLRFKLTYHGTVLIGQDLLARRVEPVSGPRDNNTWLKSHCWVIALNLLYGTEDSMRWDQWECVRTTAPHLRAFLTLTNWFCPSIGDLESRFLNLASELGPAWRNSRLTYTQIRDTILKLSHFSPEQRYLPKKSLGVAVGDIGYVDGDRFIRLDSLRTHLGETSPLYDYKKASSEILALGPSRDGGVVHLVHKANYFSFKSWGESEWVQNAGQYWHLFAERAYSLASAMATYPGFKRSELILVTAVASNFRLSIYQFDARGQANTMPPDVTAIEYPDPSDTRNIHWQYDTSGYEASQFSVINEQSPGWLAFMQLEEVEYEERLG